MKPHRFQLKRRNKLIISKSRLIQIIKEELNQVLLEANPYHDDEGKFQKQEKLGNSKTTYSLSSSGAARSGVKNKKLIKRGVVKNYVPSDTERTTVKPTGDKGKAPAGRKRMNSGEDIDPKLSVGNYPEPYKEELEMLDNEPQAELRTNELVNLSVKDLLHLINKCVSVASQNAL